MNDLDKIIFYLKEDESYYEENFLTNILKSPTTKKTGKKILNKVVDTIGHIFSWTAAGAAMTVGGAITYKHIKNKTQQTTIVKKIDEMKKEGNKKLKEIKKGLQTNQSKYVAKQVKSGISFLLMKIKQLGNAIITFNMSDPEVKKQFKKLWSKLVTATKISLVTSVTLSGIYMSLALLYNWVKQIKNKKLKKSDVNRIKTDLNKIKNNIKHNKLKSKK